MFRLFETICVENGIPQNLVFHNQRINHVYNTLGKPRNFNLPDFSKLKIPDEMSVGKVRWRVDYGVGEITSFFAPYHKRSIASLQVVYDDAVDYSLKYVDRSALENLLAQKGNCDEILIVKNGLITDTSFSNILMYNGVDYYTPKTPLLAGTKRALLLSQGKIFEKDIAAEQLFDYQYIILINAMLSPADSVIIPVQNIVL
jgi:4-amino-4-deoxychorismate lyase